MRRSLMAGVLLLLLPLPSPAGSPFPCHESSWLDSGPPPPVSADPVKAHHVRYAERLARHRLPGSAAKLLDRVFPDHWSALREYEGARREILSGLLGDGFRVEALLFLGTSFPDFPDTGDPERVMDCLQAEVGETYAVLGLDYLRTGEVELARDRLLLNERFPPGPHGLRLEQELTRTTLDGGDLDAANRQTRSRAGRAWLLRELVERGELAEVAWILFGSSSSSPSSP